MLLHSDDVHEVALATTPEEREEIYAMRYAIFAKEKKLRVTATDARERDDFDALCDHLIVRYRKENQIVGTYRILRFTDDSIPFMAEELYDCTSLRPIRPQVAEIGRVCIRKEHRGGRVLWKLWFGLVAYMRQYNIRYLFGMTTLYLASDDEVSRAWAYLNRAGAVSTTYWVRSKTAPVMVSEVADGSRVPRLLDRYRKFGSVICGEPARDDVWGCYQVPTICDFASRNLIKDAFLLQCRFVSAEHAFRTQFEAQARAAVAAAREHATRWVRGSRSRLAVPLPERARELLRRDPQRHGVPRGGEREAEDKDRGGHRESEHRPDPLAASEP